MTGVSLSARFPDADALDAALGDLRRLGAVRCGETLSPPAASGGATLYVTVRPRDAAMARAVVRRAGGRIIF